MAGRLGRALTSALAGALFALAAATAARANPVVVFNTATATDVSYTILGSFSDTFSGLTFTDGPWSLLLDSPVPSGPGSGDPWSLRVILEYAGLTGGRTDYFGGSPNHIDTFSTFNNSGTFAVAVGCSGCVQFSSLNLGNIDQGWQAGGSTQIDPSLVIPEPASYALVVIGLAGLALARRRIARSS